MRPIEILYPDRQKCLFCGAEFVPRSLGICEDCLAKLEDPGTPVPLRLPLGYGRAAFRYENEARACLQHLKFEGETWRARMMGEWMAHAAREMHADILTAVPIHPLRRLARGYAQCELLGRAAASALEISCDFRVLRRRGNTPPLYTLDPERHSEAVAGKFEAGRHISKVSGKRILLVDDVCTTGSTLTECTRILLEHGARAVDAVTFAAVRREHG